MSYTPPEWADGTGRRFDTSGSEAHFLSLQRSPVLSWWGEVLAERSYTPEEQWAINGRYGNQDVPRPPEWWIKLHGYRAGSSELAALVAAKHASWAGTFG